jgi:hypothetical protein
MHNKVIVMDKQTKNLSFQLKAFDDEQGTFEGYASIFGNKDSYGDVVVQGAFRESLKERKPKLLWQHNTDEPIGVFTEVREDDVGLYVKGKLFLEIQKAKEAYTLLKGGAIEGLSIGYACYGEGACRIDHDTETRFLERISLYEISIVTIPANDKSLVNDVKTVEPKNIEQFDRMKDFENFLKDPHSLGSQERKIFISKLKEFSKRDAGPEEEEAKKRDAEAGKSVAKAVDELKKATKLAELYLLTKI